MNITIGGVRRIWAATVLFLILLVVTAACRPVTATPPPKFIAETLLIDQPGYAYQWSPAGGQLLLMGPEPPTPFGYQLVDRPLLILELSTGRTVELPKWGYSPLWSPDGNAILFNSGQHNEGNYHLWLYTVATAEIVEVAPLPLPPVWWLPNGRLGYEAMDGLWFTTLTLPVTVDPALAAVRLPPSQRWFAYDTTGYDWAAPLPDGETLFFFQLTAEAEVSYTMVRPDGSKKTFERKPEGIGTCCAESSDGQWFAVFSFDPQYGLYLVDRTGENRRLLVAGATLGEGRFLSMTFAPDNRTLAFEWLRPGQEYFKDTQIYLIDLDGGNLRQLTPNDSGDHRWLRWSPDGNYLSFERPIAAGNTLTGLVQVQQVNRIPSLPLTLPPFKAPPVIAASGQEEVSQGFRLRTEERCPQQLHFSFPSDPAIKAQWTLWPTRTDDGPWMAVTERAGIPFHRLHLQGTSEAATWETIDSASGKRLALYWIAEQTRRGAPATQLTFSGFATALATPVLIVGPAQVTQSRFGLRCQPPVPIAVRGNAGWLLQQTAAPGALLPAINSVIWQEAGAYWQISGRDVSSGGDYTAEQLLQMAQGEVEEFVSSQEGWQTVK